VYTVTAGDGTSLDYTVTVTVEQGITISAIIQAGTIPALTFTPAFVKVTNGAVIALNSGQTAEWYVKVSGPETCVHSDSGNSFTFTAPTKPGFYNVSVIATVNGIPYAGNFVITVE
jgi:hypothetical protein